MLSRRRLPAPDAPAGFILAAQSELAPAGANSCSDHQPGIKEVPMNRFPIFKNTNRLPFRESAQKACAPSALAILALLGCAWAQAANPIAYSSGFEEASIVPFWTVPAAYGSASLSKDVAY